MSRKCSRKRINPPWSSTRPHGAHYGQQRMWNVARCLCPCDLDLVQQRPKSSATPCSGSRAQGPVLRVPCSDFRLQAGSSSQPGRSLTAQSGIPRWRAVRSRVAPLVSRVSKALAWPSLLCNIFHRLSAVDERPGGDVTQFVEDQCRSAHPQSPPRDTAPSWRTLPAKHLQFSPEDKVPLHPLRPREADRLGISNPHEHRRAGRAVVAGVVERWRSPL